MKVTAIRGATTTKNTIDDIMKDTQVLLKKIELENNLLKTDVISIMFSCTKDLTKVYPAKAAREIGYENTSLMCFQEMNVDNSLKFCIRVMFLVNKDIDNKKHIYLKKAKTLRPDLLN